MRFRHGTLAGLLALLFCATMAHPKGAGEQKESSAETKAASASRFEPLANWTEAVAAGDKGALAGLNSSLPGGFAQTPQGNSTDPNEEPEFWAGLHASGLQSINAKILQISRPQAGVVVLTLRIDITVRRASGTQQLVVSAAQVWVQQGRTGAFTGRRGAISSRGLPCGCRSRRVPTRSSIPTQGRPIRI